MKCVTLMDWEELSKKSRQNVFYAGLAQSTCRNGDGQCTPNAETGMAKYQSFFASVNDWMRKSDNSETNEYLAKGLTCQAVMVKIN